MRALLLVLIAGCATAPAGVTPLMPPGATVGRAKPEDKIHGSVWTIASATSRIEGRVREPTGTLVEGVTVVAVTRSRPKEEVVLGDKNGQFHLDGVALGIYELTFYCEDGTYILYSVPTAEATTTEVDLVFDPTDPPRAREAQIL